MSELENTEAICTVKKKDGSKCGRDISEKTCPYHYEVEIQEEDLSFSGIAKFLNAAKDRAVEIGMGPIKDTATGYVRTTLKSIDAALEAAENNKKKRN